MWPGVIGCELAGMSTDRHRHRDMDAGTGTQTWVDWKCEYKNKVKKEMLLPRLIVEAGRQGQPQQVWPGVVGCKSAGVGCRQAGGCRAGHRYRQVCVGWQA